MIRPIFFYLSVVYFFTSFNAIAAETIERQQAKATFAGGCFWCMEQSFEALPGVSDVKSGYTGGESKKPTYKNVSSGTTGHVEAIQVIYDPKKISYEKLIKVFWRNIDPTNGEGQFCDDGNQYRSVIFYHDEEQKRIAKQSKTLLEKNKPFSGSIKTKIVPASKFHLAENYHQNYYKKNPLTYKFYRFTCRRDSRLNELWDNG